MKHLLVFGSLRQNSKRGYNFNRFGGQEYIKDIELNGFEMYNLGSYPAICEGEGKIKCELHSVKEEAANYIERMEIGAGYTGKTIKTELNGQIVDATIYTWPKSRLQKYNRIESGNWD